MEPSFSRSTVLRRLLPAGVVATTTAAFAQPTRTEAARPVTTISIPRIEVRKPVYEGTSAAILNLGGFGHWLGSAMPGKAGNCMIGAHRVEAGGPLRRIHRLAGGDTITLAGVTYRVVSKYVIPATSMGRAVAWDPGRKCGLTLFSCSRRDGMPSSIWHRYVVHAIA
jgi:LPXTG-site transpeptidase (sortase) family protein